MKLLQYLFEKLENTINSIGKIPSLGNQILPEYSWQKSALFFYQSFMNEWLSSLTSTLADVYFACVAEMREQLSSMKALPKEIKKELGLYAQIEKRDRIDQCCMKAACFRDSLDQLNVFIKKHHLKNIQLSIQTQFIIHFIQQITSILNGLGQKPKTVYLK